MAKRSNHQQRVIRNYYQNREAIALQRAQEIVTELFLSEGRRRAQQWKLLATHLAKLGVAPATIQHLVEQDDPQLVAQLVKKLGAG